LAEYGVVPTLPGGQSELETPSGEQVGGARCLGEQHGMLTAHTDDRRAEPDPTGVLADRCQERQRRGKVARCDSKPTTPRYVQRGMRITIDQGSRSI
jgi:hypothetical protein